MAQEPRTFGWSTKWSYDAFLSQIRKTIEARDSISLVVDGNFSKNMRSLDDDMMKELLMYLGQTTVKGIKGEFMGKRNATPLSSERLKALYATVGAGQNLESARLEFKLRHTDLCRAAVQGLCHATHIHLACGRGTWGDDELAVEVDTAPGQLVEGGAIDGQEPNQHLAALQKSLEKLALSLKEHKSIRNLTLEISPGILTNLLPALQGHSTLKKVWLTGQGSKLSPNANKALADFLALESKIDVVLSQFVEADLAGVLPSAQVNSISFDCCHSSHSVLRALLRSNVKAIDLMPFLSHPNYRSVLKDIMIEEIPVKPNLHELGVWTLKSDGNFSFPNEVKITRKNAKVANNEAAVLAVIEAAARREDLKVVKWYVEAFSIEVARALTECMRKNKGLQEVWLSVFSADADAQSMFLEELLENRTLQRVHLMDQSRGGNSWNDDVKSASESIPGRNGTGSVDSMTESHDISVDADGTI